MNHPVGPTPSSRDRRRRFSACAVIALIGAGFGCLAPWKQYQVLPRIDGRIETSAPLPDGAHLKLVVRNRENVLLNATKSAAISQEGRFSLPSVEMSIAGQEYTNVYRVFLHLQQGKSPGQVIWRADVPRSDDNAPMTLDCLLDRPVAIGEACRLHDAAEREWFVAQGEATFRSLCADCHGGADPSGRDELAAKPPDLTRIAERAGGEFDWDTVAHWIEGRSMPSDHRALEMPVWGERLSLEYARYAEGDALIGAKLDPLIAYLEHIQQR